MTIVKVEEKYTYDIHEEIKVPTLGQNDFRNMHEIRKALNQRNYSNNSAFRLRWSNVEIYFLPSNWCEVGKVLDEPYNFNEIIQLFNFLYYRAYKHWDNTFQQNG